MKTRISVLLVVWIVLSVFVSEPAFAAGKAKGHLIVDASPAKITLSEGGKDTKTYFITQFTQIYLNGRKRKAEALKAGMTANVTTGKDPAKADRIDASGSEQ
jgi:hypothetical protein